MLICRFPLLSVTFTCLGFIHCHTHFFQLCYWIRICDGSVFDFGRLNPHKLLMIQLIQHQQREVWIDQIFRDAPVSTDISDCFLQNRVVTGRFCARSQNRSRSLLVSICLKESHIWSHIQDILKSSQGLVIDTRVYIHHS